MQNLTQTSQPGQENISTPLQSNPKAKMWDSMAEFYERKQMFMTSQPFVTLCTHARVDQAKRILEVASGPGFHTQLLASTYLQRGGVVVACDFSSQMIESMRKRFDNQDISESYTAIAHNKVKILPHEVSIDKSFDKLICLIKEHQEMATQFIEKLLEEEKVTATDRFIFGCQADNQDLPFRDGSFDAYLANLSLMMVDDHEAQLREAYRVSMPGFTVLGREANDGNSNLMRNLYSQIDLPRNPEMVRRIHRFGESLEETRKEFEAQGFTNVRIWYQPMYFSCDNFEEYFDYAFGHPGSQGMLAKLDEQKRTKFIEDARSLYEERMGVKNNLDPKFIEVMIITCQKPQV